MSKRLVDKRIFITGAAQGIGQAIAKACLNEGANIFLVDIDGKMLERTCYKLGANDRIGWCEADVSNESSIFSAVKKAEQKFGSINGLINNAGINVFNEPLQTSNDDWNRCFDVNVKGAWNCSKALLKNMIANQNGVILNIASTHSFTIIPHTFPYPLAKHALHGMTKSLALEYASSGIRVNALAPGYVETQKVRDYWESFPDPEAAKQTTLSMHPGRRIATAEEIAMAAVFLISDECPFINAACLIADGGLSVEMHPDPIEQ
ncbi:MAG: SDR family oxidoreductase [Paracoccaceae bacterium]|nr:SDR family oxidoreductase [Paracoccaceae bacterium]